MRRSSSVLLLLVTSLPATFAWAQPNLVVTDITLAAPPVAGVPNVATARLTNVGNSATGIFNIKWFLDGQEVGYGSHAPLGPGQTSSDNVFLRWTPSSSSFLVRYDADVDRFVSESDERDNSYQALYLNGTRQSLADLIVQDLSFNNSPRVGVETIVTATLRNGGSASSGGFNIRWFLDGQEVGYGGHSSLAPGQTSGDNVRFFWTPSSTGSHRIRYEADVDGHVVESNEINGTFEESVTVGGGLADLVVEDLTFSNSPRVGEETIVTARLRNQGQSSTGGFNIKWFLDGQQVGYGGHASLGPGQVSSDNVFFYWTPASAGSHRIRYDADVDGQVEESSEGNNSLERSVNVEGVGAPDLAVLDVNFSAPPRIGEQVRVQALLRNLGNEPSGNFNIKWFQNDTQVGYGQHVSLAAGATSNDNIYFFWTPTAAGTYRFRYQADVDGHVQESNESNNSFERSVTIAAPNLADLVVDDLSFSPAPSVGVQTVVTARLRNAGTLDAPQFNIKWFLDGAEVGYGLHLPLPAGATSSDNVRFVWTPSSPGPHRLRYVADVDSHVDESNEANNSWEESVDVAGVASPVEVRFSPGSLGVNADGWYTNNPVTVEVTLTCPTTGGGCSGLFSVESQTANGGRIFYYGADPGPTGDVFCDSFPFGGEFSHEGFVSQCNTPGGLGFFLDSGESRTMRWLVWVQPSDASSLSVVATWGASSASRTLAIPKAQVRPLVFIHGILGSMPPQDLLVASRATAGDVYDPFLGSYWPILDNFLKMGYEWDRTLFGLAYDWRNSNRHSGAFLARQLSGAVIPRSRNVSYVSGEGKADLVVHSMGGLVSRSYIQDFAIDRATGAAVPYQGDVRKIVFIASPHKGFASDYQTREGMTWEDYLYNAPFVSGTPFVMTVAMDGLIWPALVEKKYDPTDAELARDCIWVPFGTPPQTLVPYHLYFPRLRGGVIGYFVCTIPDITPWSLDPARGARSLFEMLPTEDMRPYLLEPGTGAPEPYGHEVNTFLRDLNATVDRLGARLGPQNIFVIYGEGAPPTDLSYEVGPPGVKDWRFGEASTERYTTAGDDLIPSVALASAQWHSSFNLPAGNEARLDAAPEAPDGARHKEIMFHAATQRTWVPRYLTGADFPVSTPYSSPLVRLDKLISVMSACPINLLVTDPQGRRLGYDPVSGTVLREIPNSVYTGPNAEPQILLIGDALPGEYRFTSTGYDSGPYLFRVDRVGASGPLPLAVFVGETSAGVTAEESVTLEDNSPPGAVDDRFDPTGNLTVPLRVLGNDVEVDSDPLRRSSWTDHRTSPAARPDGSLRTLRAGFAAATTSARSRTAPIGSPRRLRSRGRSPSETTRRRPGALVSFQGAFTPVDALSSHTIRWDFGDGGTSEGVLDPSHAYADNGLYPVTLSVTDDRGVTGGDVLSVFVSNVAPVVEAGADVSVDVGVAVPLSGSFLDPGAADTHEARWDFGDGGGSDGLAALHAYGTPGIYTASLLVRDDDGGEGTDSLRVEVRNIAPLVDAGPDVDVEPGASVTFAGSFKDPGDDGHEIVWDFGDGAKETGTLTPSHVFAAPGVYTVTLTVTDPHGSSGSDSLQVRAQCRSAWIETFDSYEPGADPEGWVDYEVSGGHLRSGPKVQGFRAASSGGDIVYRSVKSRRATEYRTEASLLWRNYELTGNLLLKDDEDHAIFVYTDVERGLFYQLQFDDSEEHEGYRAMKGDRELEGRTRSDFEPREGVWYSFRVRVEAKGKKTRLRARFWPLEKAEPKSWQIDAEDGSKPLTKGAIGFAADESGLQVDDLRVEGLGPGARFRAIADSDGIWTLRQLPRDSECRPARPRSDGIGDACDRCTARFEREKFCLDRGYDERTGLSSAVVEIDDATRHHPSGGECGERGHYRLASRSGLVLETPALPEEGLYRIQLQVAAERKHDGLDLEIEGKRLHVALQGDDPKSRFWWTRPILVHLSRLSITCGFRAPT
jgi:subtilase family serine protease/PKD repeat protein